MGTFIIPSVLIKMSFYCVFLVLYEILNRCSSIYLIVSDENLDWVAQSTIKVNLLLKVLLKLIVNYFCCTNVN